MLLSDKMDSTHVRLKERKTNNRTAEELLKTDKKRKRRRTNGSIEWDRVILRCDVYVRYDTGRGLKCKLWKKISLHVIRQL